MIGMSFQTQDENLKIYNSYFENSKRAFVLKEDNLRISLNGTRGVDEDYFKLEVEPGFGNVDNDDNDDGANETIQPQINKQQVTQISDSKNKRIAANEVENVKMENEINQLGNTKDVNKIIDTLKKVI
jgi:hypothetical protein